MITVTHHIQYSTVQYTEQLKQCYNKMQRLVAQCIGNSILQPLPHLSRWITVNYI